MYMVQILYDLENCGIGSEVQLYTNPNTAIRHAVEAKNKHLLEFHIDEEPEVNEKYTLSLSRMTITFGQLLLRK